MLGGEGLYRHLSIELRQDLVNTPTEVPGLAFGGKEIEVLLLYLRNDLFFGLRPYSFRANPFLRDGLLIEETTPEEIDDCGILDAGQDHLL